MRRRFLLRCGGYDASLPAFDDWDLWLTGLGQPDGLTLSCLDLPCFENRIRPNSMLQHLLRDPKRQRELMVILRQKHGSRLGHGSFSPSHIASNDS